MSRKRTIVIAGIALLVGLALVENATRSDKVLPATIGAITASVPDAGPDIWHISFTLPDGTEGRLGPVTVRPTLETGASSCIRVMKRSWAATKYQRSTQQSC